VLFGRVAAAVKRVPPRRAGAGFGVLILGVSGLFGGLKPGAAPPVPTVRVGAVNQGVPWNVTVTRVRLVSDTPPLLLKNKGDRWLLVLATVEVTADESRQDIGDALRVTGVTGLLSTEPAYVVRARDATYAGLLNPGMPERLGFFWEQSSGSPVPTRVDVQVYGMTHRLDSLTGLPGWYDPAVRAQVPDIPVEDKRT
jgi:hypothetical protein